MSASLVGSEMCIRDSRSAGSRRSRPRAGSFCGRALWALATLSLFVGSWPVSYTHLTLPTICSV
eukprot:6175596-Alexandrium_andersonii.AAC.1